MTYTITIYDTEGKKSGTKQLNKDLYNDEMLHDDLMHEYLVLQQANGRIAIAHTKTRGEIRGSGKKLYKQKGTGNARVGDKKSPTRKGGGVAFGPRNIVNYSKKMTKKMRRRALLSLVSLKAKEKAVIGLEGFMPEVPKTKEAIKVITALGLAESRVVMVLADKNPSVTKSIANIPQVRYILANYLNPQDLLWAERVVCAEGVIDYLNTL